MGRFRFPKPIVDSREKKSLEHLTSQYDKFLKPGLITTLANAGGKQIEKIIPQKIKSFTQDTIVLISESRFMKTTLIHSMKGLVILQKQTAKITLSKKYVVDKYKKKGLNLSKYSQIVALRSYDLIGLINTNRFANLLYAAINGSVTGFFGFAGVPFNIPISLFLYFRVVQNIALHFGYDVIKDPIELDIAANVMIMSLAPNKDESVDTITGMLGKMMIAANATALRNSLSKTFEEIAKQGEIGLFYVQIRALARKQAQTGLEKAGRKNLEFGVFKKVLEQFGKKLPKKVVERGIPYVGAFIGAGADIHYMNKVINGAILIYHKRFIIEKEERVKILRPSTNKKSS